jgi:nitroreductase
MIYNDLKSLLQNRRTARLTDTADISSDYINKILDIVNLAPSSDKLFPYKVYALTNSPEGRSKKEQLVNFFRCGGPDVTLQKSTDPFADSEMVQPILSGFVLVFVCFPKKLDFSLDGKNLMMYKAMKDIAIAGTYAMLAGESLGLKTGMFGNLIEFANAVKIFDNSGDGFLGMVVTFSNRTIPPILLDKKKEYFEYNSNTKSVSVKLGNSKLPFVFHSKQLDVATKPTVIKI